MPSACDGNSVVRNGHLCHMERFEFQCESFRSGNDSLFAKHRSCTIDKINGMLHKEASTYACRGYLPIITDDCTAGLRLQSCGLQSCDALDGDARGKICGWYFTIVDHFDIRREIVSIALSFLDRYLANSSVHDKRTFKLAASAAIFMAVKIHEPTKVGTMDYLPQLTRGEFNMRHISIMERIILQTLGWYVNPPTAVAFVDYFLSLPCCPSGNAQSPLDVSIILNHANFFIELSMFDPFFISRKPSHIAAAAILNVMESSLMEEHHEGGECFAWFKSLAHAFSTLPSYNSEDMLAIRSQLWILHTRNSKGAMGHTVVHRDSMHSPVCVSGFR